MKRFNFKSMTFLVVLMVLLAGCTAMYETAGGYEEAPVRKRVYTNNPYSGNVVVVERDPFTGQYYQVSPNGFYGTPYNNFGYGNGYSYPQRSYNRGSGNYRPAPARPAPSRPQPVPQRRGSATTDKAKEIIRGNNR